MVNGQISPLRADSPRAEKVKIVILGAGFGGLRAARLIAKGLKRDNLTEAAEVILIDRNDYQTYTPLLYEIASTSHELATIGELKKIVTFPLAECCRGAPIRIVKGEISEIDTSQKIIRLNGGASEPYDTLIIGLGAESNTYNIPGVAEYGIPLKTFLDAIKIRDKIALAAAEKPIVRVLVGGGGSSGVEIVGELHNWICELETELGRECRTEITIVESQPTILSGIHPRLKQKAFDRMKRRVGIHILMNERITKAGADFAELASGKRLPFDAFIWTGGVKPGALVASLPFQKSPDGRLMVAPSMQCLDKNGAPIPNVYALGDLVFILDKKTNRPLPQVAPAALDQAKIISQNILTRLSREQFRRSERHRGPESIVIASPPAGGRSNPETWIATAEERPRDDKLATYTPRNYPYVIPVGGKYAVAKVGNFIISGFFGWVLKGLVEFRYLLSIMPVWQAFKLWLKGLKIFLQNDRLG